MIAGLLRRVRRELEIRRLRRELAALGRRVDPRPPTARTREALLARVLGLGLLLAASPADADRLAEVGVASVFAYHGDRHRGGPSPCLRRDVLPTDMVIAHRRLPCGTLVTVTNRRTGASVVAAVGERGPYGACLDDAWTRGRCSSWTIKRRASDPGVWRGIADLTPAVAAAIGHRGFERVRIEVVR